MSRLTLRAAALLLDMDGTLVHSTGEVETVWRLWCRRHRLASLPTERWALVTSASQRVARHRLLSAGLALPTLLVEADDGLQLTLLT